MEPVTWSSGGTHLFLDPRQQGRHRAPIRWRVVEQAVAGLREQHDREVLALRRAEPLERRCTLLRRLRTVLAPVDPDPGHSHLLQQGNRVEPGGLQLPYWAASFSTEHLGPRNPPQDPHHSPARPTTR